MSPDEGRAAGGHDPQPGEPGWAARYAATHRVLRAHADLDGRGAHWLEPGETCTAREAVRGSQMEAGQ